MRKNYILVYYIIFCLLIISGNVTAQPWLQATAPRESSDNFFETQKKFHDFWKDKKVSIHEAENEEEGGYQQFARWENFIAARAYPSGKIPDPDILIKEYERTKLMRSDHSSAQVQNANWNFIGPHVVPGSGGGAGRINCIAFHPSNSNIIYVGAACGGVWKTTDGGLTWSTTTDQLASISIADIAINPVNPNILYVATGDGYGYEVGYFWGGTYTAGIMKSTDGGLTWTQSGLTYNQTQSEIVQRVLVNPQNPNIILACTRNAIFRSSDGAATWNQVQSGHFYDMEFNALNPSTVYACNSNNIYRSINGGNSFQLYSNSLGGSGRVSIAVTAADTNVIYALTEEQNFFRSVNGGQLFIQQPSSGVTLYGYYDCVLAASPVNSQRAIIGGFNMKFTDDGGNTWNDVGDGTSYIHVDNHVFAFLPGSNTTIFSGNDGGLFKTTNTGDVWTDLSNGLAIKQYYRLSSSEINPNRIYAGAQDNGTDQLLNSTWTSVLGGDGMDCLTDYSDENTVYASYQNGGFNISTDGGLSFSSIAPCTGAWTTPIVQDPVNPNTIYIGCQDLYKSTDKGSSWNIISTGIFSSDIIQIAIAPSNPNYIYACSFDEIHQTTNGGLNWTDVTSGLPIGNASLSAIAVSSSNPLHVWVACSGYSAGDKVFHSVDGGNTWMDVSGTLPNIPVDCIVYQKNTNDELYIGTDFGVYYTDASLIDWLPYQAGLPNVIVDDIEINYTASKLRVATYGRGIWESDLNTTTLFANDAGVQSILSPTGISCNNSFNPSIILRNFGLDTLHNVNIQYRVDTDPWQNQSWIGVLPPLQTTSISLGTMTASPGPHTFTAYTANPNGSTDNNLLNDQKISAFEIDNAILSYPVTENFETAAFPLPDWNVMGAQSLLSFQPYGGFGLSDTSIMADFYNLASAKSYLASKQINFSSAVSPLTLEFNVAYAEYNATYHDTLNVSVSTDCGTTWTNVYSKTGSVLATAPALTGIFTPAATEWRAETVNLDAWIGIPNAIVRFGFLSGYGNQCYVDDINLHDGSIGISELMSSAVFVSPVPFDNVLFINSGNENIMSLQLTDVAGKVLMTKSNMKENNIHLNTENLSRGVYFLKLITSKDILVKKVVKA